jgi:hypothetical protein
MSTEKLLQWGGQVSKNLFSDEDIRLLSENPNVEYITETSIAFTPEFKRRFYEGKKEGKSIRSILIENGIDPNILGEGRIKNLSWRINRMAKREAGFTDLRSQPKPISHELSEKDRLVQLERKILLLEAQIDFLKKIQQVARIKKK